MKSEQLFEALARTRFGVLPHRCGQEVPGCDEAPEWQIWTARETTWDQKMMEKFLDQYVQQHWRILHIGVGNSSLAARFSSRVDQIVGTTLHAEEKRYADDLILPNYKVQVANKYGSDMENLHDTFDVIADNNPTSFACCLEHFSAMLCAYRRLLSSGGIILSAQPGIGWVVPTSNALWGLTSSDWIELAQLLGLEAEFHPDEVYAWRAAR